MASNRIHATVTVPGRNKLSNMIFLAVALFICSAAFFATVPQFEPPFDTPIHALLHSINHTLWWEYYAVGLVVMSALAMLYYRSYLQSWVFTFAVSAGIGINLGGIAITGEMPSFVFRLVWAIGIGIALAITLGTLGSLIGVGTHRISR